MAFVSTNKILPVKRCWTKLDDVPDITTRCFHTMKSWVSNSATYIAVNGGLKYQDRRPIDRLPINEFVVLKFESQSIANYSIRKVVIPMIENDLKFVSYHASVYFDSKIYIPGGYSQCVPTIDNQAPLLNNKMYKCDLSNKDYDVKYNRTDALSLWHQQ